MKKAIRFSTRAKRMIPVIPTGDSGQDIEYIMVIIINRGKPDPLHDQGLKK